MSAATFYPGNAASITIAATAKPLDQFEVSINGEPVDTTNFTSGGWAENWLGIKDAEITFSGPYNGVTSGATASDAVGTSVTFVLAFGGGGPSLTIPARLANAKLSTDVKGVAKISGTAKSNGVPTLTY